MANPAPHERLNDALEARRLDFGWNWKQLAAEAGISAEALAAIRRGANKPNALTARGIDRALKWEPGSVNAILDGGDPTPVDTPATTAADDDIDAQLAEARELLRKATELLGRIGDQREAGGRG